MKIKEYARLKDKYRLPEEMLCAGNVKESKYGHVLAVGFNTKRYVYSEIGYVCDKEAPEVLHACVCALMELVFEMPLIKTVLLKPEIIYEKICENEFPSEEIIYYSKMALCALNEAFKGYLSLEKENE